jgi:hypothetical protein
MYSTDFRVIAREWVNAPVGDAPEQKAKCEKSSLQGAAHG